ncbi:MAG: FHA domain-containing protein, partial [Anaerolineales bacterium]
MSQFHKHDRSQGQFNAPGKFFCYFLFLLQTALFFFVSIDINTQAVRAQSQGTLLIQAPDLTDFPILSLQIKLPYQPNPTQTALSLDQLQVFEDEHPVSILSVNEEKRGVYFTLAVNGGFEFDLRDANGISPYNKLSTILSDWGSSRPFAEEDSFSFVTNDGIKIHNTAARQAWVNALEDYQPDFRVMEPELTSLETAIELAREWVVPLGVDKALLYITLPPSVEQIEPLRTLTEDADLAGIHISVWMIGDAYFLTNDQGKALIGLAERTGGKFFYYTDENEIPDPESYLSLLGNIHTLTYQSAIRKSGTYSLRVQASLPNGQFSSENIPFEIILHPPNPILLSPPTAITCQASAETQSAIINLIPDSVDIEIMIEFPDGYPRPITASRLYVDGQIQDVHLEAPFNLLTWDLSSYRDSSEHQFQVEVEDSLGLTGRTILTPMTISVISPEVQPESTESKTGIFILGGVIFTALAVLLIWLIPRFWQFQRIKRFRENFLSEMKTRRMRNVRDIEDENRIYATLLPLSTNVSSQYSDPFPVTRTKVIIGSEPKEADFVVDKPDIHAKQAQLYLKGGNFWLKALYLAGGTWV